MSEAVYERVRERHPALLRSRFDLQGKAEQVAGRILAIDKQDAP